jgi:hypothetical protein
VEVCREAGGESPPCNVSAAETAPHITVQKTKQNNSRNNCFLIFSPPFSVLVSIDDYSNMLDKKLSKMDLYTFPFYFNKIHFG